VDQAFDAVFELDEGAVGHEVDHLAVDARADRVALARSRPRGWGSFCLRPSAIFSFSRSMLSTTFDLLVDLDQSLGWLMRPQDMSVMCSRPSMPPRSTNAPKSAMFLTVPLIASPSLRVEEACLGLGALFFDELAAADDDVAAFGVDLEDLRARSPADELADVVGRRMSTCEAGRKTGTPMSTSRPPLIFRMTLP
jgi:hypothetical protein